MSHLRGGPNATGGYVWGYDWATEDALHATPDNWELWRPDGELRNVRFEEYGCEWHEREYGWHQDVIDDIEAHSAQDGWRVGYDRFGFLVGPHEPAWLFVRRADGDAAQLDKDFAAANKLDLSLHRYLSLSDEERQKLLQEEALEHMMSRG